ncbi:hypothetical protein [Candidatus Borreliella tachyglossi]|uniref:hypothetical protein n=1 Tax=Candidatus Borreliella tachyglossi TaxID=1964448 RepID=UPI0040433EAB
MISRLLIFVICFSFFLANFLHSNETNEMHPLLRDYSRLAFYEIMPGIYVINLVYEIYSEGKLQEETKGFKVINSRDYNASLLYMEGKKSNLAFLADSNVGYFMLSNKSSKPIKVSPSYQVKGISSLQDIIGLRFDADFSLLKVEESRLSFKSNKNSLYPLVDLVKVTSGNGFITLHKDRNARVLKEVFYRPGIVSDIKVFSQIEVTDKIFENNLVKIYIKNVLKTNLNNSIFTLKGFPRVFDFAKSLT